ncbi:MAG: flavocytochrome c [Burkholderiaceae bacterium]
MSTENPADRQPDFAETPSRRFFMKAAGAAAVAGAAAGAAQARPRATGVDSWDQEFDVIIVGSGYAALAAAYEAQRAGVKRIVVLEKMEAFGGNSAINGGLVCLPLSAKQKEAGIKDSVELMVADMVKAGRGFNHVELCRALASNAAGAYDMMMECGVKFKDKVIRLGGHSAPRALITESASGGAIVVPMHKYLRERGVMFRNHIMVDEFVRDTSGVTGVIVREGYTFGAADSGLPRAYRAKLGVVVASGGWGQDKQFVSTTMPVYSKLEATAQPGATAETIKSLLAIGALPIMLDMYQLGPWASPDERGAGPASFFADYAFAEGIAVDPKTGRRFMNELADRRTRADAQLAVLAKGSDAEPNFPFAFCGEDTTTRAEGFEGAYRDGAIKKSATLEDLAKRHNTSAKELRKQIDEWNAIVAGRAKDPFAKPLDKRVPLKAPYYSLRLSPKLHYCMGGVAITPRAEAIDARTCKPIPGLYAAGEVTGGTHGMDRLGGCSSIDGLVFGQIAGRNVARRVA